MADRMRTGLMVPLWMYFAIAHAGPAGTTPVGLMDRRLS